MKQRRIFVYHVEKNMSRRHTMIAIREDNLNERMKTERKKKCGEKETCGYVGYLQKFG